MKKEIKIKIKQLSKKERNILIFELLYENIIDFTEIIKIYVNALKKQKKEQKINISGLVNMLSVFIPFNKKIKDKKFIEAKSAWHILKSGVFKTAPIEERYKEIVKKSGYNEDENGNPTKII